MLNVTDALSIGLKAYLEPWHVLKWASKREDGLYVYGKLEAILRPLSWNSFHLCISIYERRGWYELSLVNSDNLGKKQKAYLMMMVFFSSHRL